MLHSFVPSTNAPSLARDGARFGTGLAIGHLVSPVSMVELIAIFAIRLTAIDPTRSVSHSFPTTTRGTRAWAEADPSAAEGTLLSAGCCTSSADDW